MSEFKGNKPIAEAGLSSQSAGQWAIFRDSLDGILKVKKDGSTTIDLEVAASIPNVIVINSNITIDNSYHNKVIIAETGVVITLPVSLSDGLSFRVWNNSTTNSVIFQSDGSSNLIERSQNFAILDKGRADVNFQLVGNNYFIEGDMTTDLIPLAIGGGVGGSLKQWFDFSDFSTLTMNGLTIQAVQDKSGSGNNIENLVASEQAERIVGGQNSLDTARFQDCIYNMGPNIAAVTNSDMTLFIVSRAISTSTSKTPWITLNSSGTDRNGLNIRDTNRFRSISKGSSASNNTGGGSVPLNQWNSTMLRRESSTTFINSINGAASNGRFNNTGSAIDASEAYLGAERNATTNDWDGEIAEVLLYNRRLNTSEQTTIEQYLIGKWGL